MPLECVHIIRCFTSLDHKAFHSTAASFAAWRLSLAHCSIRRWGGKAELSRITATCLVKNVKLVELRKTL